MARRRRLAPKVVVSSDKFVAAAIVCHEGAWSYSGEEEIAWPLAHHKFPQRRVEFTRGCTGWIQTSVKQTTVSPCIIFISVCFTFLAIIVLSLNCASVRSTWVCSTCVQGAIYIDRNTLQNIHPKFHIVSSSKGDIFLLLACLPA